MPKEPPAARRAREQRELQFVRDLVKGLDHDGVYLLAEAAELRAVVLDHLDRQYPDPDRRRDAARLRALAELVARANQARDFVAEQHAQPSHFVITGPPGSEAAARLATVDCGERTPTPSWTSWPQPTGEPTSRCCGSTGSQP
jgi:hypothetical protein